MDLEAISPILEQIVKDSLSEKVYLYGRYQKSLTSRVASGKLRDSISTQTTDNKQGIIIMEITAFGQPLNNTYAYWLANGRQPGKFANIKAIEQWIRNKKSFKIRNMKTGKFLPMDDKNIRNVAYLIARSLGRFGFQNIPQNFVDISYEKIENNQQILELIGDASLEDLLNSIEGL